MDESINSIMSPTRVIRLTLTLNHFPRRKAWVYLPLFAAQIGIMESLFVVTCILLSVAACGEGGLGQKWHGYARRRSEPRAVAVPKYLRIERSPNDTCAPFFVPSPPSSTFVDPICGPNCKSTSTSHDLLRLLNFSSMVSVQPSHGNIVILPATVGRLL